MAGLPVVLVVMRYSLVVECHGVGCMKSSQARTATGVAKWRLGGLGSTGGGDDFGGRWLTMGRVFMLGRSLGGFPLVEWHWIVSLGLRWPACGLRVCRGDGLVDDGDRLGDCCDEL